VKVGVELGAAREFVSFRDGGFTIFENNALEVAGSYSLKVNILQEVHEDYKDDFIKREVSFTIALIVTNGTDSTETTDTAQAPVATLTSSLPQINKYKTANITSDIKVTLK